MAARTLDELRERLASLPPPVVVFSKSHSGSRLLARLLAASGVFMGADLNASEDAVPLLKLVQYFVAHYHPDASARQMISGFAAGAAACKQAGAISKGVFR